MTVYIAKWTPFRYACALKSLQQGANNVNGTTDPKNRQINRNALLASAITQANAASPYALAAFALTGLTGQISFTVPAGQTLQVGQQVIIAGTFGGTGSIVGYASPTTYVVSTTNGTTTATLTAVDGGAIVTIIGTPSGITETVQLAGASWAIWRVGFQSRTSSAGLLINVPLVPGFVPPVGTNDDGT